MARKTPGNAPPGRRHLYWLGAACKEARKSAKPLEVAYHAGVSVETIRTFELGRHQPSEPDKLVAAYALVAGIADGRDLYQRALDLWRQNGVAPSLDEQEDQPERRPSQRAVDAVRLAAQRERARTEARERAGERPNATRKKRSTGG